MQESLRKQLAACLGKAVEFDVPMARFTSLRVGGPADALVRPGGLQELEKVFQLTAEGQEPAYVIGGGFNTLVPDSGVRGLVVHLGAFRSTRFSGETLRAGAGASHATVTRLCAEAGQAGLEFAVGIPGTVGGWVAMNAGIPEREMKDVVDSVEVFIPDRAERAVLQGEELRFRYRSLELPSGGVVLSAQFRVTPEDPDRVRERMREHLERRRRTQPIDRITCGSVFKNPPGDYAARLIEAAGLKGLRVGDAEISSVHANFIVNRGRAMSADVRRLMDRAQSEVRERFAVDLEPEVRVLGGTE
jgi:UDP-N-acetylmuramate dehydrogenase